MSKMVNMLSILWLLKKRKQMTAEELAQELEVSIRTVYRYIDALCASGVPIISDAGHNGGYRLLNQFIKVPLFFNMDEQKALIHAARFAQEAGYPFSDELSEAISKLKLYLNPDQLDIVTRHAMGLYVIDVPNESALTPLLKMLEVSIADGISLNMNYKKGNDILSRTRKIDPYGLVYWKSKWYVIAYCQLRLEIRSFRVDRIQKLTVTDDSFLRPEGFDARSFLLQSLLPNQLAKQKLIAMRIHGKEEVLNELCQHWLFGHALTLRAENEAVFQIDQKSLNTFVPYFLLPYGNSINIVEPLLLKQRIVEILTKLLQHYQK
jgi:predicted DNA-binding transcriptional regulator YafY